MAKSMFTTKDNEDTNEELVTAVDVSKFIDKLKRSTQTTLNKLKAFSEIPGRRMISELNQIIDATELNEFLRMAYNDDHPTVDSKQDIRSVDYMIEKLKSTGEKIIKASKEKGLSFCTNLMQLVDVTKARARRSKNKVEDIRIYKVSEDAELPRGLAFNKDSPGHVSLIATQDMTWNDMVEKLRKVGNMLEYVVTIRIEL